MPISLTSLVTGANRLLAGRNQGRTEGEEMRERAEERRRAAERQALQDSLQGDYQRARTADLLRPEQPREPRPLRLGDPGYLQARAEELRLQRSINPPQGRAEFSENDIDAMIAQVAASQPPDTYPPPSRWLMRGQAIQLLRDERDRPRPAGGGVPRYRGGTGAAAPPVQMRTPEQWVEEVRREHPQWTAGQLATEARRRAEASSR